MAGSRPRVGAKATPPRPSRAAFADTHAADEVAHALAALSENTRKGYLRDIETFKTYAAAAGLTAWTDVTGTLVRAWLSERHAAGLAPRSLQRALSSLRLVFRSLVDAGLCSDDPCAGLKAPRAPRLLPRALDVDAVQGLLDQTPDNDLALRDRTMFELAYSCGLRVSELVGVRLEDFDGGAGWVRVIGKRDKERQVPVGGEALTWVRRWLAVRATWLGGERSPWLFISAKGAPLTTRTVQRRLTDWARRAGLPQNVHPHMLRHSFASHMLESSGDLRAVQELLGHTDIASTQIYTRLDFQRLATVYDAAHPRARRRRD